jgi:hypothetical protein
MGHIAATVFETTLGKLVDYILETRALFSSQNRFRNV